MTKEKLFSAIRKGYVVKVRAWLNDSGDVNAVDQDGNTALMAAAHVGNKEIVNMLLAQTGIDIKAENQHGETALQIAEIEGHKEIADILKLEELFPAIREGDETKVRAWLENGGDVNAADQYGRTTLIAAAYNGKEEIVKLLLAQEGIYIDAKNWHGQTAFSIAASSGHGKIADMLALEKLSIASSKSNVATVRALLEHRGYWEFNFHAVDRHGNTALQIALQKGHTEIVEMLEREKFFTIRFAQLFAAIREGDVTKVQVWLENMGGVNNQNRHGYSALMAAVADGKEEIVEMLLAQKGIDLNAENERSETALTIAINKGNKKIVKMLLAQEGIDPNACGRPSPLETAVLRGNEKMLEMLLAHERIDPNYQRWGETALMMAVERRQAKIVKMFLSHKEIDPNVQNEGVNNALMIAINRGDEEIVEMLLAHERIDLSIQTKYYKDNALTKAAHKGNAKIFGMLLARGEIDINFRNDDGKTALRIAVCAGHTKIVELLLDKGADVNESSQEGHTLLMSATICGHKDVVELLVARGANIHAQNNWGDTALDMARTWGMQGKQRMQEIEEILQDTKRRRISAPAATHTEQISSAASSSLGLGT